MTDEAAQRAAVVAEARTWLGTPFRDQADRKGAGVDCAMLLVRSFVDTGVLPPFDPRPYPPRWHLHKDEERFLGWIRTLGRETEELKAGNVILYKEGRCFSHGALLVDPGHVVHASWRAKEVLLAEVFQIGLTHYPRTGQPRPRLIFDMWAASR